jgi:hypothetical protein
LWGVAQVSAGVAYTHARLGRLPGTAGFDSLAPYELNSKSADAYLNGSGVIACWRIGGQYNDLFRGSNFLDAMHSEHIAHKPSSAISRAESEDRVLSK